MSKLNLSWQSFLVLMGLGVSLNPAIAATPQPVEARSSSQLIANLNLPNTDRGEPDNTTGGGKRGDFCLESKNKELFRAVLPVSVDRSIKTKTAKAETTFWWYIPENKAVRAEFSVFTEDGSLIDHKVINKINEMPGLLGVTVSDNLLKVGETYHWDLTLVCDQFDRSGDYFSHGEIERADVTQLKIAKDAASLDVLASTLRGQNSYLSMEPAKAQSLAAALDRGMDDATVNMVNGSLLLHFKSVSDEYTASGESMSAAEKAAMKLELAQLSAFFGLWSDAVNLIASERQQKPSDWQSLLESIFPADNPSTVQEEDKIVDLLSAS